MSATRSASTTCASSPTSRAARRPAAAAAAATAAAEEEEPLAGRDEAARPARRSRADAFLAQLQASPFYRGQLVYVHETRPAAAQPQPPPSGLCPAVTGLLRHAGIESLFSHQAAAVEQLLSRGHVMLATPTASGKSLAYNLPVLHAAATQPEARAVYIFPTKALAHDQLRALRSLASQGVGPLFGLDVATYDGDTPQEERRARREGSRVLLTNPDMLHTAVLPAHKEWASLLSNLRYVVVDEAHMYSGAFGAHVASVLRRLRRLAAMYGGGGFRFACCSATLGNPRELFCRLTGAGAGGASGEPLLVVDWDGSPRGRRQPK